MASHFKWYPSSEDRVVPWNATYEFPSEANKSVKITPRIPPKNGATFTPGNTIRLEFPAQGYVNPAATTIAFDVTLDCSTVSGEDWSAHFQNNIQSIFSRIRLMYGSTPLEDLIQAGVIVRQLTEWTNSNAGVHDQTSISEGIGGYHIKHSHSVEENRPETVTVNTRLSSIQGVAFSTRPSVYCKVSHTGGGVTNENVGTSKVVMYAPDYVGTTYSEDVARFNTKIALQPVTGAINFYGCPQGVGLANRTVKRRYQIQLPLGLFQQGKLLPTKFMASQLAVELTLDLPANCIMFNKLSAVSPLTTGIQTTMNALIADFIPSHMVNDGINYAPATGEPTFRVTDVTLIPEILEMDASYDAYFLKGLQAGGVPMQFASWNTFVFPQARNQSTAMLQIQERNRSIKSIFAIVRLASPELRHDMGATFADIGAALQSYQFRIGGRYFPASPVICNDFYDRGPTVANGASEPFLELQKALGTIGDARLSIGCNSSRWAQPLVYVPSAANAFQVFGGGVAHDTTEYPQVANASDGFWKIIPKQKGLSGDFNTTNRIACTRPLTCSTDLSSVFVMSTSLETTNGREISGLNAEEQSDISLIIKWGGSTAVPIDLNIEVYTYFDGMVVLRENNIVELIK